MQTLPFFFFYLFFLTCFIQHSVINIRLHMPPTNPYPFPPLPPHTTPTPPASPHNPSFPHILVPVTTETHKLEMRSARLQSPITSKITTQLITVFDNGPYEVAFRPSESSAIPSRLVFPCFYAFLS